MCRVTGGEEDLVNKGKQERVNDDVQLTPVGGEEIIMARARHEVEVALKIYKL